MVRTLFGVETTTPPARPGPVDPLAGRDRANDPGTNLTIFKVHFGLLTLKAYTKGEHVLRFEAIVHNTRQLRTGRALDKFAAHRRPTDRHGRAVHHHARLRRHRVPARRHPRPATRNPPRSAPSASAASTLNKPRIRAALAAVTRVGAAPEWIHRRRLRRPGQRARPATATTPPAKPPTICASSAANTSSNKPGKSRRYHVAYPKPPAPSRALLTLRDHVIAPILAGVRSPESAANPTPGHPIDRDYETLRIDMRTLFTRPRHQQHQRHRRIDNNLSIRSPQASSGEATARRLGRTADR